MSGLKSQWPITLGPCPIDRSAKLQSSARGKYILTLVSVRVTPYKLLEARLRTSRRLNRRRGNGSLQTRAGSHGCRYAIWASFISRRLGNWNTARGTVSGLGERVGFRLL